jgi:hypothetical protein
VVEEWKPVPEFEGIYEVSNCGRVRRIKPSHWNKINYVLKHRFSNCGYPTIMLWDSPRHKTFNIHRLVARVFLGEPNRYFTVNHKDGNKTNNHVSNLEWMTMKENFRHFIASGRYHYKHSPEIRAKMSRLKKLWWQKKLSHKNLGL